VIWAGSYRCSGSVILFDALMLVLLLFPVIWCYRRLVICWLVCATFEVFSQNFRWYEGSKKKKKKKKVRFCVSLKEFVVNFCLAYNVWCDAIFLKGAIQDSVR
jgi:hypothetical protein